MKIKIYIFYVLSLTVLLILWKKQRFFYKKSTTSFNLRHSCSVWTSEEFDYTSGYLQSGNFSTMLVVVFQICKSFYDSSVIDPVNCCRWTEKHLEIMQE